MFKENIAPTKQGVFYQLNLGKNNGPFLCKDIMHTIPKSIALIAGNEIVKSYSSMNLTLSAIEDKQKQFSQSNDHVINNFTSTINHLKSQITIAQRIDTSLRNEQQQLKVSLQQCNESISLQNVTLLQENMPLLKRFHKIVKEEAKNQKEIFYKIEKELDEIVKTKKVLLDGIFECERRIIQIQQLFGIEDIHKTESEIQIACPQ